MPSPGLLSEAAWDLPQAGGAGHAAALRGHEVSLHMLSAAMLGMPALGCFGIGTC